CRMHEENMAKCPFAQWMPLPWNAGHYWRGLSRLSIIQRRFPRLKAPEARPATKAGFKKTIRASAAQRKSKRGAGGNRRGERRRAIRKTSNLVWESVNLPTMLILRGIAGHFAGRDWPRGALDEPSALQYAGRRGYVGEVLDVDGATGPKSR